MQYTEQDLSKLIESVEKEFTADLLKAEEALKASTLAKSETAAETAPVTTEEPKVETKVEQPLAKAEDKKEDHKQEDCEYDDEDKEELHKMYKSMSKKEIEYHKHAIEKCGEMSMAKSEQSAETKVEAKVEDKKVEANPELELLKSEVAAEKAKNEDLKKSLDALIAGLDKFVKKSPPQGKAITELATIAKSEGGSEEKTFSKAEVNAILEKKASDPSLKKSDRDAINAYYLSGANINTISHLLK